jgi:thiamine biosynthesis lipoprotein
MNTIVEITGVEVGGAVVVAATEEMRAFAVEWERMFSRFQATSTLQRINRAEGMPVRVEPMFLDVLERARQAAIETRGRFNPAILPALEAVGYDRTFEEILPGVTSPSPRPYVNLDWNDIRIDHRKSEVRLLRGLRLDFGGIAKGAFVDQVANRLGHWPGGSVNAGGDLFIWGVSPSGESWVIGVEDPEDASVDIAAIRLGPGIRRGIATSASNRRQWMVNGMRAHHVIDSATGLPAAGLISSVTVVAACATDAEIEAKSVFVGHANGDQSLPDGVELAIVVDDHHRMVVRDHRRVTDYAT